MNVLYFYLFILVHPYLSLWWKSFEQAGRKPWEALIPVYNYYVVFKLGCKKPFWSLLLVFPGVHIVMWSVANVSYIRRFGYFSLVDTLQGIFFPYIIMAKIANSEDKILPETNWANTKEMGDREWGDHLALFLALPIIGHALALGISAVTRHKPGKKSKVKEWGDSIWFALIAASIIRTYVFEPFQIPTGSMEKTLLVGDFLFVNKLTYGPKVPVTPLSYPLVHNTVPWVNVKSYTSLETSDYTRLPGFSDVNRNDVVVFNYPSGDTAVYDPRMPNGLMGHDYHGIVNNEALRLWKENNAFTSKIAFQVKDSILRANQGVQLNMMELDNYVNQFAQQQVLDAYGQDFIDNNSLWKSKARKLLAEDKVAFEQSTGQMIEHYGVIYRPVDKRENYIKRCVGIPGDWLEIKDAVLYVNGKKAFVPEFQNLQYQTTNVLVPSKSTMDEKYGMELERQDYYSSGEGSFIMNLTKNQLKQMKRSNPDGQFDLVIQDQYSDSDRKPSTSEIIANLNTYPKDFYVNNTMTNFTKFQIPKKGQTINIDKSNIAWYRRIITAYEGHKLEEKSNGIYIDGKKTTTYTFGMNYYWMMGDNRYNSADSRVWGFVPEDHIVGKASMVWFSKSAYKGIRWERLFNVIK
ncbi:MAG: signal peptidase I [Crocinitomicaceae bacterium]|jgi:signal peptidase I|nr:signal peptidase I [Crocinitomicaceae bacterium]